MIDMYIYNGQDDTHYTNGQRYKLKVSLTIFKRVKITAIKGRFDEYKPNSRRTYRSWPDFSRDWILPE